MNGKRLQASFFARMEDPQAFRAIFEHLPEVYFFVKDREGRMIAASPTILERLGMRKEEEFLGSMDWEVFPATVAAAYRADDAKVFASGLPLVNRLELWLDEQGRLEWCVTTKVPIRGRGGEVIGLMGLTRRDPGSGGHPQTGDAERAVRHLREHRDRMVQTAELAEVLGVSVRTLNRRINQLMGVSPYELGLRVRVQAAAEWLIGGEDDIAAVAVAHGFCDQSSFTRHFRLRMGITPKQFRMRNRTGRPA